MFTNDHLFLHRAAENRPDAFSAFRSEALQTKIDAWALPGQAGCPLLVQTFQKTREMRRAVDKAAWEGENKGSSAAWMVFGVAANFLVAMRGEKDVS